MAIVVPMGGRNDIYRNRCFLCGMFHIEDTDRKLSFCFSFYDDCSLLLFSGGPFWIATGIATSTLLGGPRPDEDSFVVFCRYPMFNAKYGFIFDIIGAICIIVGLIKVF